MVTTSQQSGSRVWLAGDHRDGATRRPGCPSLSSGVPRRHLRTRARDDSPDLAGQFLLYPIVDHGFETASYREHAESPVDAYNPFASLSQATGLSSVAPATIVTAGVDVLRDEGVAYARQLEEAGVQTDHLDYPSLAHGFLSLTDDVGCGRRGDDRTGRVDSNPTRVRRPVSLSAPLGEL